MDDPDYEASMGHDPSPWEGYSWFFDSRTVDEGVPLNQRAPWVAGDLTYDMDCLLWRTSSMGVSLESPGLDPGAIEDSGDESGDGEEECASRWIVDSGTTFETITDREAELAGMPRFP